MEKHKRNRNSDQLHVHCTVQLLFLVLKCLKCRFQMTLDDSYTDRAQTLSYIIGPQSYYFHGIDFAMASCS